MEKFPSHRLSPVRFVPHDQLPEVDRPGNLSADRVHTRGAVPGPKKTGARSDQYGLRRLGW